ncbi:uncharacterized protein CLUP02_07926 [Colletotrichum lupini]|uniref:Uncharacterized protein n=1 Tax=Colletotrichum lupini TaxID=145971 RepID=A0A9Q8SS44_9PEZI|nr:uncharacterized protein CLUP02_07926 [Colletotrichum lupini]UQC82438.1 hypothetical protein CLUP02_07926 [Colletotrichum lupini]
MNFWDRQSSSVHFETCNGHLEPVFSSPSTPRETPPHLGALSDPDRYLTPNMNKVASIDRILPMRECRKLNCHRMLPQLNLLRLDLGITPLAPALGHKAHLEWMFWLVDSAHSFTASAVLTRHKSLSGSAAVAVYLVSRCWPDSGDCVKIETKSCIWVVAVYLISCFKRSTVSPTEDMEIRNEVSGSRQPLVFTMLCALASFSSLSEKSLIPVPRPSALRTHVDMQKTGQNDVGNGRGMFSRFSEVLCIFRFGPSGVHVPPGWESSCPQATEYMSTEHDKLRPFSALSLIVPTSQVHLTEALGALAWVHSFLRRTLLLDAGSRGRGHWVAVVRWFPAKCLGRRRDLLAMGIGQWWCSGDWQEPPTPTPLRRSEDVKRSQFHDHPIIVPRAASYDVSPVTITGHRGSRKAGTWHGIAASHGIYDSVLANQGQSFFLCPTTSRERRHNDLSPSSYPPRLDLKVLNPPVALTLTSRLTTTGRRRAPTTTKYRAPKLSGLLNISCPVARLSLWHVHGSSNPQSPKRPRPINLNPADSMYSLLSESLLRIDTYHCPPAFARPQWDISPAVVHCHVADRHPVVHRPIPGWWWPEIHGRRGRRVTLRETRDEIFRSMALVPLSLVRYCPWSRFPSSDDFDKSLLLHLGPSTSVLLPPLNIAAGWALGRMSPGSTSAVWKDDSTLGGPSFLNFSFMFGRSAHTAQRRTSYETAPSSRHQLKSWATTHINLGGEGHPWRTPNSSAPRHERSPLSHNLTRRSEYFPGNATRHQPPLFGTTSRTTACGAGPALRYVGPVRFASSGNPGPQESAAISMLEFRIQEWVGIVHEEAGTLQAFTRRIGASAQQKRRACMATQQACISVDHSEAVLRSASISALMMGVDNIIKAAPRIEDFPRFECTGEGMRTQALQLCAPRLAAVIDSFTEHGWLARRRLLYLLISRPGFIYPSHPGADMSTSHRPIGPVADLRRLPACLESPSNNAVCRHA